MAQFGRVNLKDMGNFLYQKKKKHQMSNPIICVA